MRYIADLHIHSLFSRATSKASHLHGLASWAAIKGIQVIGTGDFTHPVWFSQLVEYLEEAEPGFFRLKPENTNKLENVLPEGLKADTSTIRFVLTTEISSIYKRGGKVRKVHNILFAPDLDSVRRINATLAGIGNIESDGRPILGLDSRDLLEIVLEKIPEGFLVPAHIWTPWFSLFGSKSGFDTIEACFGDLSEYVFALETGLSSDPDMNRMISALDRFTLISNSDCHSPGKLGREANIFSTGFDFYSMRQALKNPVNETGHQVFDATLEFYPEEGKYHCDGHRKCGVCLEPLETQEVGGICPKCGKPVTVGVLNRVMELADRPAPFYPQGSPKVHSLVPLPEILSELVGTGPATKRVMLAYVKLIQQFGTEFHILLDSDIAELEQSASPVLAEAVRRVRSGQVIRTPGYDGEFGIIRVFSEGERSKYGGQLNLFGSSQGQPEKKKRHHSKKVQAERKQPQPKTIKEKKTLNPEQHTIIQSKARHIIVKAGPGTGKTHTLVQRVIRTARQEIPCTVITFTNKAADELKVRIDAGKHSGPPVFVATLHGYCLHWLRMECPDVDVAGPEIRRWVLRSVFPNYNAREIKKNDYEITTYLQGAPDLMQEKPDVLALYLAKLVEENLIDIDEVVPRAIALVRKNNRIADQMRRETGALFVDEFQDLNKSQYELVKLLAATSPVFAIGDPDQAIYGFRGASPVWFSAFIDAMQPEQYILYRNYRSGSAIVEAAGRVIHHIYHQQIPVEQKSAVELPARIYLHTSSSPQSEADFILGRIETLLGGSSHREVEKLNNEDEEASLADIAILYRTGRQAEILADTLSGHGFPVQVVDIVPFFRSGPTYPLYCWSLAAAGFSDTTHLHSILKLEKGIGPKILAEFERATGGTNLTIPDISCQLPSSCSSRLASTLDRLQLLHTRFKKTAENKGIDSALRMILSKYDIDEEERDVTRFFQLAGNFGTSLDGFAAHLKRYNDTVVYDERAEVITLMTLHAAKGLEFPIVFVTGLEEALLPLAPRQPLPPEEELKHIEEERRLFYVGMTRAERVLYLTNTSKRVIYGEMSVMKPSRFLAEIPDHYISRLDNDYPDKKRLKKKARQLSLF